MGTFVPLVANMGKAVDDKLAGWCFEAEFVLLLPASA